MKSLLSLFKKKRVPVRNRMTKVYTGVRLNVGIQVHGRVYIQVYLRLYNKVNQQVHSHVLEQMYREQRGDMK